MDAIDLNKIANPTYNDSVKMESPGLVTNTIPAIRVKIPKANVHPQLSIALWLVIANIISNIPPIIKEILIKIAIVSKAFNGVLNTAMLVKINTIPTIRGMYQCLRVSFNEDKI